MTQETVDTKGEDRRKWLHDETKRSIDYIRQIGDVHQVTVKSLLGAIHEPDLTLALHNLQRHLVNVSPEQDAVLQKELKENEFAALIARNEAESGFSTVNAHAAVALWGAMEAWIEDVAYSAIASHMQYRLHKAFADIRISVAEYEAMDAHERAAMLAHELQRTTKSKHLPGIARFEGILAVFDLSGATPADVRRDLLELLNVRNVIVHRASVADETFVTACPWMSVVPGQRLSVSIGDVYRYRIACGRYLTEVIVRALPEAERSEVRSKMTYGNVSDPQTGLM
ncbi:MAG: hypothetical protein M3439_05650 [Chloroflexota bacterium]|nr:hypothetical protein [Chloroflexota bacterium]